MLRKVVLSVLPGDLTPDCSIIRANAFIVENLVLMTKNILIVKTLKLLAQ